MTSITRINTSLIFLTLLIDTFCKTTSLYEKLYLKCPKININDNIKYIFGNNFKIDEDPLQVPFKSNSSLLLSAIITFRHGERTTGKGGILNNFLKINCSKYQSLTPLGAKRLTILGQILYRRYNYLLNSNSLFITSAKNRCLQSLLNFLQGFRNLNLHSMTRKDLENVVETDKFFEKHNFHLLHDCNNSGEQFLEVAGRKYAIEKEDKKDKPYDLSEDNDYENEVLLIEKKNSIPIILYEFYENPLKKFTRELFKKNNNSKNNISKIKKLPEIEKKNQKTKEPKKEDIPKKKQFYLRILK